MARPEILGVSAGATFAVAIALFVVAGIALDAVIGVLSATGDPRAILLLS